MRNLSLPASMGTLLVALSLAYIGCSKGKIMESALVASVTVSPKTVSLTPGHTAQLTGSSLDEYGTPVGARLAWESASNAVATVSGSGVVTAVGIGSTYITVGVGEMTDVATVTVTLAPVASVGVTPQNPTVVANQTTQLTATTRDADGVTLTGRAVTWETSASGIATVSSTGLVRGIAPGTATITARSEGQAGSATLTVQIAPVATITLSPASPAIIAGGSVQLVPVLRDATGAELSGRAVTWETSAGGVATVSASGLVTGVAVGTATITARSEGQSGTTVVTVQATPPAPVASVTISPTTPTVLVDGTVQLSATLRSANGTVLTGRTITWETSAAGVATVGSATGLVRGVAPGSATITARSEGQAASTNVTVQPPPVATITLAPLTPSILVNGTVQLSATLRDAGGAVLTGRAVTWETSAAGTASVNATGLVTGVAAGNATITARSEGQAGSTLVTVQVAPAPVATIALSPATPTINVGANQQLTATLRDAQGVVLTGRAVTWETSAAGVATVSTSGLVHGVAPGTATITARSEGQAGSTLVTVQLVPVATVAVAPGSPSVQVDATVQLTATLRDAGGTVLTGRTVTWETSAAGTASVSSSGLVRGVAAGGATITARSEGQAGTASVTVTAAPPPPPAGAVADPTLLPVANRQLPDFANYPGAGLRSGQSYTDPASGVRVWKLTDPSSPVGNNEGMHDYSSGAVQVSRGWGTSNNTHTVHLTVAGGYLVDLTRGVGLSNWRSFGDPNTDLCFTFSQLPASPQIAYYTAGTTLYKLNTATMQRDNTGGFPKSFSSVTSSNLLWLQQDKNDTWFVMMPQDASRIIAWNRLTNETKTIVVPNLNEPHLDKDGRYVLAATNDEPNSWRLWDMQTGSLSAGISKEVHPEFLRSLIVSMDPNTNIGQQYMYDPRTMTQTTTLGGSKMSPNQQHHAGQWVLSDAELPGGDLRKQWMLWSGYDDGIGSTSGWTQTSGSIYWATPSVLNYDNRESTVGVQSVRQFVAGSARVARQLTRVASQAALVDGSFYWDAGTNRVYVWAQGGGSPNGRVEVRYPAWVHDGLGFMRADGSEVRFLAHHYSVQPTYWDAPRATISADGKIALFSSNSNASGRPDAYAVEVPIR